MPYGIKAAACTCPDPHLCLSYGLTAFPALRHIIARTPWQWPMQKSATYFQMCRDMGDEPAAVYMFTLLLASLCVSSCTSCLAASLHIAFQFTGMRLNAQAGVTSLA